MAAVNPVQITLQQSFKELNPTVPVTFALLNAGDKVRIETTVKVAIVAISSIDSPFVLNKTDGVLGAGWVYDPNNQFGNFKVGDVVLLWNYFYNTTIAIGAETFTIIAKQGNGLIQLDHSTLMYGNDTSIDNCTISSTTPITAIKYRSNFIKNNGAPTYISPVDEVSEQMWVAPLKLASDTSSSNMLATGQPEWQNGFPSASNPPQAQVKNFAGATVKPVTIVGVSIATTNGIYTSIFKITHYCFFNQFLLYQMTLPPFNDNNCLKVITKIDAMKLITDPNVVSSAQIDNVLGTTGWYDANYNISVSPYQISNLTYKVGGNTVPSIQLDTTETVIEFDVTQAYTLPFAVTTQFVINFHKVPADPSEYKGTGKFIDENFLFDRALQTVGSAAVNGENYGGTWQVLKGISASLTSTSVIHVTVKIDMVAAVLAGFTASSNPQYFLSFATFNLLPLSSVIQDDAATIKIDQNTFYTVTSDPTMIIFEAKNVILRHPEIDPLTQGIQYPTAINVFPEDELSAYSEFYIESATRLTDVIQLQNVKEQVIVSDGSTTFILDEKITQLAGFPFIGYAQFFNTSVIDQFHLPIAETLRKYYNVQRRQDLDTGTRFYFSSVYPFLFRWETWTAALGVDVSFFNTALPNNGFNEWWFRYKTGAFRIYHRIIVNATKNGVAQQYTQQQELTPHDYSSNASFTVKTIKTYDLTNTQLVSGGVSFINGFENTEIRAVFTNVLSPFAAAGDNYTGGYIVIGIEAFEAGGIAGKRRYSGKWVADSDTWFLPLATTSIVKQTNAGDGATYHTITGKCYLDYTQLPAGVTNFKITARIYDNVVGTYQEECITQKVSLIPANPVPSTITSFVPVNPLPGCCNDFVLSVLADATGKALQNDVNSVFWFFDPIVTGATMELKQWNGSAWITVVANLQSNTSYGTPTAYNSYVNPEGQYLVGYKISWAAVRSLIGTGSFKVTCSYTVPVFGNSTVDSYEFCLQTYSQSLADGTVRLEYWMSGVTGDIEDDTKIKDFGNLNWYNSIRVKGFFGYPKSTYKSDDIQYNSGQFKNVEDEQIPEFKLKLYSLPFFIHEIIKTDFMQADRLCITDYNSKNNAVWIQKFVRKKSGYEPKWYDLQSNLASVELQFTPESNRFRKLR